MATALQRAPVVYAFDTKEAADAKKLGMEKWLQASTEADDAESYWWPMVYQDILCGKTLWLVTMVGFRAKDAPKKAKERERWLKKKIKELEKQAEGGCAARNVVTSRSCKQRKRCVNTVPSTSSSTRRPICKGGKKHVDSTSTTRRKRHTKSNAR